MRPGNEKRETGNEGRKEREALGRITAAPADQEKALAAAGRCLDALNRALDGVMRENGLAA